MGFETQEEKDKAVEEAQEVVAEKEISLQEAKDALANIQDAEIEA